MAIFFKSYDVFKLSLEDSNLWLAVFKKRRIKKEFDTAVAEGNDAKVERLVQENGWLADYVEDADDTDITVKRVCAAIGIMEDELNAPTSLDDIVKSLDQDFKASMSRSRKWLT